MSLWIRQCRGRRKNGEKLPRRIQGLLKGVDLSLGEGKIFTGVKVNGNYCHHRTLLYYRDDAEIVSENKESRPVFM